MTLKTRVVAVRFKFNTFPIENRQYKFSIFKFISKKFDESFLQMQILRY